MERRYVPKCVTEGKFEGFVSIKEISIDEYYDEAEKAAAQTNEGQPANHFKFAKDRLKAMKDRVLKVELKRVADGRVYKSYDDLALGTDGHKILEEIALGYIKGFDDLGKSEALPASK